MLEHIVMILLGMLLLVLGILNMLGNISSIHWYNRRNITEENRKPYGKFVGIGTVIMGAGLVMTGLLQIITERKTGFFLLLSAIIVGLGFMGYAQIKYNRGFF